MLGFYFGEQSVSYKERVRDISEKDPSLQFGAVVVSFEPFWKTWSVIDEKFVSTGTTTAEDRVWGAIEGLVNSLNDPYSVFLPPDDAEIFNENIIGNFGGVGMEIGIRDGVLTVVAPLKDTPAEKAGIETGDKILEVDGVVTTKMRTDEAVKLIRGEMGTKVELTISREGVEEAFIVEIVRGNISIPTIETTLRDDGIFMIELYSFTAVSPQLFEQALQEFVLKGNGKLILDLRNNPGGFLDAAVDMASWFLPAGTIIVSENFGEKKESVTYRSKGYDIFNTDVLNMVVLINEGSASASEILAGALSEHGVATLIGEQSFGKGSVQELVKITKDTSLKITVAEWKTPQGKSFSKEGLIPDIEIELTTEDREANRDPQVEKAVEFLLE